MKRLLILPLCAFVFFQSCQETKDEKVTQTKQGTFDSGTDTTGTAEETNKFAEAVCVWDKSSLRDTEGENGKWLTSLNLGEKVTYLNESKKLKEGNRDREYIKVRLQDGKEGWTRADLVIAGAKGAAVITKADIYTRPDLLTKSDKSFSPMDIVAVKSKQNEFIEVVGKRAEGKWLESAWIREGNVSYKDVDIAVAKYGNAALALENKEEKIKKIREITENNDLSGSTFISSLKTTADELEFPEEGSFDEAEEDFSDEILEENMEAAPSPTEE